MTIGIPRGLGTAGIMAAVLFMGPAAMVVPAEAPVQAASAVIELVQATSDGNAGGADDNDHHFIGVRQLVATQVAPLYGGPTWEEYEAWVAQVKADESLSLSEKADKIAAAPVPDETHDECLERDATVVLAEGAALQSLYR